MNFPQRQPIGHTPPTGLPSHPIYFLTICTSPRGKNQLCHPETAKLLIDSAEFYHARGRWWVHLFLLMPDHLHALVSFPDHERMGSVVCAWKHYHGSKTGIIWQRDFFDHRLRTHEGYDDKASYIRQNPIRAGLILDGQIWPYMWEPSRESATAVTE